MKIIKRLNPNSIIVKYNHGRYQGRIQTSLDFKLEYADALRSAINLIREGNTNVTVIQYRDVMHTHSELYEAMYNLSPYPTDEEIIEEVHYVSRKHNLSPSKPSWMGIIFPPAQPLVWAGASL